MLNPPRCRLSDPLHPHTLSRRRNPPPSKCSTCGDGKIFKANDWHFYCKICKFVFHQECEVFWLRIKHPYHLNHSLNITIRFSETEVHSFNDPTEYNQSILKLRTLTASGSVFESGDRCDWCGLKLGNEFYRCLECGFSLDRSCVLREDPFTITNPKSHQHPVYLFPRPLLVPCTACGLDNKINEPGYVCLPCNFIIHKSCIDLPRVIKLTRHPHRLCYAPCLPPPAKRLCGVCHRNVDVKYGLYICNKGCSYAVHSKCATHRSIWDGIDLEGVPEEPEEDLSPFIEVGYNLIKHFSHEHNLIFNEDELNHDGEKECQACCRAVDSDGFYRCTIVHCDFFLHSLCANFPKKKEHPVHKHPLTLQPAVSNSGYNCCACGRKCNGFSYTCLNKSCVDYNGNPDFKMDVGCTLVYEPFEHKAHPHPMFLFSGRGGSSLCGICHEEGDDIFTLRCNDCEFAMCFKCATIPVVIRYKHDEHALTLSGGENSSDPYWCERCERQLDPKEWFYTCNECCTTLHIDCVFGDSSYTKIGYSLNMKDDKLTFASNNGNSRPFCDECGVRCLYRGYFKGIDICLCSFKCLSEFQKWFCDPLELI